MQLIYIYIYIFFWFEHGIFIYIDWKKNVPVKNENWYLPTWMVYLSHQHENFKHDDIIIFGVIIRPNFVINYKFLVVH